MGVLGFTFKICATHSIQCFCNCTDSQDSSDEEEEKADGGDAGKAQPSPPRIEEDETMETEDEKVSSEQQGTQ